MRDAVDLIGKTILVDTIEYKIVKVYFLPSGANENFNLYFGLTKINETTMVNYSYHSLLPYMKKNVEKNFKIADRVPPGDRWQVINVKEIQPSLTDALNAYYEVAVVKPQAFRLEPMNGSLYMITTEYIEMQEPEPKKYSIYGDYEF
jgi:hypothetical protein